jgi:hypothetical protein
MGVRALIMAVVGGRPQLGARAPKKLAELHSHDHPTATASKTLAPLCALELEHRLTPNRQSRIALRAVTDCRLQGASPQFPGVLVGPPHVPNVVRKCHQMSSKEHIQLGWVVRWVLSTPPGHLTAGRCVRVVPVLPLLLCTRPARARPSIGGQSPTPAPRQLPWSPPRGWCSRVRQPATSSSLPFRAPSLQIEIGTSILLRSLSPTKSSPAAIQIGGWWALVTNKRNLPRGLIAGDFRR